MTPRRSLVPAWATLAALAGCLVEIADLQQPPIAAGGAASSSTGAGASSSSAGGAGGGTACPTDMVHAADATLNASFCIDRTEVTEGSYVLFLVAVQGSVPVDQQPAACSTNTELTHTPDGSCSDFMDGSSQIPVHCVDWCDAHAYCNWAGKRLCGALSGGSLTHDDAPVLGEWHFACTGGLQTIYPYGDDAIDDACNIPGTSARAAVGSFPQCEGGYPGLFDMQGNVAEWVDACEPGAPGAQCRVRGGHTFGSAGFWRCDNELSAVQLDPDTREIGFRCCRDAD
jgi:sulfatase modifying factor 1